MVPAVRSTHLCRTQGNRSACLLLPRLVSSLMEVLGGRLPSKLPAPALSSHVTGLARQCTLGGLIPGTPDTHILCVT